MKILFTGASSFTGYWFVKELAAAGHDITATFRGSVEDYDNIRSVRVNRVLSMCTPIFNCTFGDSEFLRTISSAGDWDLLCHHGADVTDHKRADFDVSRALANNTLNLHEVLAALAECGCAKTLLTGSVFEAGEGAGSNALPALSPYGLSKEFTWQTFQFHARQLGIHLGKLVIPNPFGPFEDPRFTAYLVKTWKAGRVAKINTPDYVRDNIHVSLLAKTYRNFAEDLPSESGISRLNPSGYIESQGKFARRCAEQISERLGIRCGLEMLEQTNFSEPRIRINTDTPDAPALDWSETAAWDQLADYYR